MEYITTKEASAKWGISTSRITVLANQGRIPGAQRIGKSWLIPSTADKPTERKAALSHSPKEEPDDFSFPLYRFRPDWSSAKEAGLSKQQRSLLIAENALMECRFADAYPLLESILRTPNDISLEIGALSVTAFCCIALNKPKDFSRFFLRLQALLSVDFPHREDLAVIFDVLITYVQTIGSSASKEVCNINVHEQCLPLVCLQAGYIHLSREVMKPGSTDITLMELTLRFLQSTGSLLSVEMMHCYLMGIYYLRHNAAEAERHAEAVVQIAFENRYYFPLVTFYRYFSLVLSPVLAQYPIEFRNHCHLLSTRYEKNITAFFSTLNEEIAFPKLSDSAFSKLQNTDYPYIGVVLMDMTNTAIAEKFGVSPQTVKRKLDSLCEKLGISTKKELRDYLRTYM